MSKDWASTSIHAMSALTNLIEIAVSGQLLSLWNYPGVTSVVDLELE